MQNSPQHITDLLARYIAGRLTEQEVDEFMDLVSQSDPQTVQLLEEHFRMQEKEWKASTVWNADRKKGLLDRINAARNVSVAPVHRIHFLKTAWFRYAAAIAILIMSAGVIYYFNDKRGNAEPAVAKVNPVPVQNDVAPGGDKATLTLADGSTIILDSANNGKIAQQDNATITKSGGQVLYTSHETRLTSNISYNTMTTPRGGQYQLTLPDGSRVRLNAASSITYPVAFTGNERKVSITGEVYFEVAKDRLKPFRVTAPNDLTIEVLGTHFNINAYSEEQTIKTTLLEGRVKLTTHYSPHTKNAVLTSLTLKPGQQGQLSKQKLSLAETPDVEQVMAWKTGVFNFNNLSLTQAMAQLARWYDVEVIYEGTLPKVTFGGKIGMDLNLSQVLKGLSMMGVKYRIEGKKLIVTS